MKKILVIVFSNLKRDSRVMRQIGFLKGSYDITVVAYDANPDPDVTFVKFDKTPLTFLRKAISSVFLLLGLHEIAYRILHDYRRYVPALRGKKFDIIIANDIETLPIAFAIADGQAKVFFDAHEYAPRHFEDRLYWRIFFRRFNVYLCKKYIPKVGGMSTVNHSLAKAYAENFGVKPIVITNAADYFDLPVLPRNAEPIRLVHHGIFTISRQPDVMIDMMKMLGDRFTLDMFFVDPGNKSQQTHEAFERFKARAATVSGVRVLPPLLPQEIIPTLHTGYDIGVMLIPPVNFNYENTLPNKFFDCVQARLGIATGPTQEIASSTQRYAIGVVSKEFTGASLAEVLQKITLGDVNRFKNNAALAAKELNADFNKEPLLKALAAM